MFGFAAVLYGLAAYAFFFVTFLYAIAFVGDFPVPKTIDSGAPGELLPSLLVDVALLGLFAVQHSLMARPFFKRWWTRLVPPPVERSTYVALSSLVLVVLFVNWRPLTQAIWTAAPGAPTLALTALSFVGYGIVLISTFLLSHFELFGLQQVFRRLLKLPSDEAQFRTPSLYKVVRHPLYLGFIVAFWATPKMTLGHLLFAVATTGYILIAIQFEERDLVGVFGDKYRSYRQRVPMILPLPRGRGDASPQPAKPPAE